MKRFALKLVVFLLLGAILNVAVAWGCVYYPLGDWHHETLSATPSDLDWWHHHASMDPSDHLWAERRSVLGYDTLIDCPVSEWEGQTGLFKLSSRVRLFAGIPCRSMSYESYAIRINNSQSWQTGSTGLFRYEMGNQAYFPFPKRPVWPGFAINTIFYAAILWLPFAALGAFRRRRRIKRGLCPKCGYDLRGSASQTCPECGKPVTPRSGGPLA